MFVSLSVKAKKLNFLSEFFFCALLHCKLSTKHMVTTQEIRHFIVRKRIIPSVELVFLQKECVCDFEVFYFLLWNY